MERLIYNSREASQLLGISRSTLLRITKVNALRKVNISSRRVGWKHSELLRYISENTPN